jgi:hypothetical protein
MRIERVPLNAGSLGDHADGRSRRANAAMQIDGGFDDAPAGFRLLLGSAFEGVGSCHHNLITLTCAFNIDKCQNFDTQLCAFKF